MEFIESLPFTRRLYQLGDAAARELLNAIQRDLLERPDRGRWCPDPVAFGRLGSPIHAAAKESAAGTVICHLYLERRQHIHLLIMLDKNEVEDASNEQRRQIRDWVERIKKDTGR